MGTIESKHEKETAMNFGRQIVNASRIADLKESIRKLKSAPTNSYRARKIALQESLIIEIKAGRA